MAKMMTGVAKDGGSLVELNCKKQCREIYACLQAMTHGRSKEKARKMSCGCPKLRTLMGLPPSKKSRKAAIVPVFKKAENMDLKATVKNLKANLGKDQDCDDEVLLSYGEDSD